ncbi:hypothetical protein, partial [Parapedobacter tibetensis]|uniref:hypothetical protein n=1 Tax=Parapedobacter tibetensis TaxID=2972951 RepID=UPI0021523104
MMDATMHGQWPGAIPGIRKPRERVVRGRFPTNWGMGVWVLALAALALFNWSGPLLRWLDPTAAVV